MAANTENFACRRLGKIIEESKQRLDFVQEFSKLKRIHNQTLKKVATGEANGQELAEVENFCKDRARKIKS